MLITSLGPAVVALLGTLIALRHQRKVKAIEINSSARLRARELMFNSYEKVVEGQRAQLYQLGKVSGEMMTALATTKDVEEERSIIASYFGMLLAVASQLYQSDEELERALNDAKLLPAYAGIFERAKQMGEIELKEISVDGLRQYTNEITAVLGNSLILQQLIMERKREELFRDYL